MLDAFATSGTSPTPQPADVAVTNHGTLFLFDLLTPAAHEWVQKHVVGDTSWIGEDILIVEHLYAPDLADGMTADGLVFKTNNDC